MRSEGGGAHRSPNFSKIAHYGKFFDMKTPIGPTTPPRCVTLHTTEGIRVYSRLEQETTITVSAADDVFTVWSSIPKHIRRMKNTGLCGRKFRMVRDERG